MEMSKSKEIGLRCKRLRMAKGMTQQELAEKLFTTPQNISKYEREGMADIDIIEKTSVVLGHSLLQDEYDQEGQVGEVGKEILYRLLEQDGFTDITTLEIIYLHGMDRDRISNEIFKLERIGMCVREQYIDFNFFHKDRIFITAKGAITISNSLSWADNGSEIRQLARKAKTYEKITGGCSSYNEFIEKHPAEILISMLPRAGEGIGRRMNYIEYLKTRFSIGAFKYGGHTKEVETYLPAFSCYYDIIYSMAVGLTRKKIFEDLAEEERKSIESNEKKSGPVDEKKRVNGMFEMKIKSLSMMQNICEDNFAALFDIPDSGKMWDYNKHFEENAAKHEDEIYPTDWFTCSEIEQFINENMGPAVTEEEKLLDMRLRVINKLNPRTLEYYRFPKEWEENGLADLVRKNCGLLEDNIDAEKYAEKIIDLRRK